MERTFPFGVRARESARRNEEPPCLGLRCIESARRTGRDPVRGDEAACEDTSSAAASFATVIEAGGAVYVYARGRAPLYG